MTKQRRPRDGEWPHRGDTQLDQARTVARDLLRILRHFQPSAAAEYERRAPRFGITWLGPVPDTVEPSGWMTRDQVAQRGHVKPDTVSQWSGRGIVRDGRTHRLARYPQGYSEREVDHFIAIVERRLCRSEAD